MPYPKGDLEIKMLPMIQKLPIKVTIKATNKLRNTPS